MNKFKITGFLQMICQVHIWGYHFCNFRTLKKMCHIDKIHESNVINKTISYLLTASDESNEFLTDTFNL
jgi:hypothetical protein